MNLLHRVEELSMQYSNGSRRAIGTFVMQERRHLHELSVQDIAEKTYTSKASLTRFAKELGFLAHTTMEIMPGLVKNQVPIVALTSEGDNILRQQADFAKEYEKNLKYKIEQGILLETPRWINSKENDGK